MNLLLVGNAVNFTLKLFKNMNIKMIRLKLFFFKQKQKKKVSSLLIRLMSIKNPYVRHYI